VKSHSAFQNETIPRQVLHHIHVHVVPRRCEGDNFKLPDPLSEDVSQSERKEQAAAMRGAPDLDAFV
jgi:histidine triad (HIT) family protein